MLAHLFRIHSQPNCVKETHTHHRQKALLSTIIKAKAENLQNIPIQHPNFSFCDLLHPPCLNDVETSFLNDESSRGDFHHTYTIFLKSLNLENTTCMEFFFS